VEKNSHHSDPIDTGTCYFFGPHFENFDVKANPFMVKNSDI